jgi:hypothetical protein
MENAITQKRSQDGSHILTQQGREVSWEIGWLSRTCGTRKQEI